MCSRFAGSELVPAAVPRSAKTTTTSSKTDYINSLIDRDPRTADYRLAIKTDSVPLACTPRPYIKFPQRLQLFTSSL
jgi:hypothetical protein